MSSLEQRARELAQTLGRLSGLGHRFAAHYAVRLAVVLGDNAIRYIETTLEGDTQSQWAVVLLDDHKVIHMQVTVPEDPAGERMVTVDAWSRATLQALHIPPAVERNEVLWGDLPDAGWPRGASIRLEYAREQVLHLPLDSGSGYQARMFGAVLPSLLEDLLASK